MKWIDLVAIVLVVISIATLVVLINHGLSNAEVVIHLPYEI